MANVPTVAAAVSSGAVPPGSTLPYAASAAEPGGYLVEFRLIPRDSVQSPRLTAFGKANGCGRVAICLDADARKILGVESPETLAELLSSGLLGFCRKGEHGEDLSEWRKMVGG